MRAMAFGELRAIGPPRGNYSQPSPRTKSGGSNRRTEQRTKSAPDSIENLFGSRRNVARATRVAWSLSAGKQTYRTSAATGAERE